MSKGKILLVGESWHVHTTEAKGFDVFTYDYYEEATEYIRAAVETNDYEFVHIPSHLVERDFPASAEALAAFDAVIFSDVGANTMNLPMNLNDIDLWEKELLKGFALPLGFLPEIGEVVNILEPFKRLTIFEPVEKDGETTEKRVTVGIIYRSDGLYAWDNSRAIPNEYDEAIKWSPASQLPEYAIRRKAIVTKFEYKPLRSFTADDIKLLRLDYASQDDPQLLMEEYLPIKNFELLYGWWKQHYKATLKDCDNPQAIILHLASTD